MKKIVIFFLVLVLGVVGGLLVVKSMTAGLTATAEDFFEAASNNQLDQALALTSTAFRQEHPAGELGRYLHQAGLDRYVSSSWSTTNYHGGSGELDGRVVSETGAVIPVRLTFVKEGDFWQIHSLEATLPGLAVHTAGDQVPDLGRLKEMASQSLHDLALALQLDDFTRFHAELSDLWRSQVRPDELKASFFPFTGRGEELMAWSDVPPVFNETPAIDQDGVLRLKGSVPRPQGVLRFEMSFVFEYPDWKLRGLRLAL